MEKAKLTKGELYDPLPESALPKNAVEMSDGRSQKVWETYMEEGMPSGHVIKEQYDKGAKYETLTVTHRRYKRKQDQKGSNKAAGKKSLIVRRCKQKASKMILANKDMKYQAFVPLMELWRGYIDRVIQIDSLSESNYQSATNKLLKADLHGSPLVVQKSRCPSYVGVGGIVVQETRNIIVLITQSNVVKRIPKKHTIFSLVLGKFVFSFHGNQLLIKPGDRAGKKFKAKATIDL